MPRPNPPRKRRPAAGSSRSRADAALNRQTAQSANGPQPVKGAAQRASASAVTAPPSPDEMWSRRSYAILIGIIAVLELIVTTIQWALSAPPRDSLWLDLLGLNPVSLLIAAIIAPFIARPLSGERRPLRPVESLMVGVMAYFIAVFVYTGIGFLLLANAGTPTTSGSVATPCPTNASCSTARATPGPTASATAAATSTPSEFSPAPTATASTASSSGGTTTVALQLTPAIVAGYVGGDIVIYAITLFVYPPLYKRLRIRRPPPAGKRRPPARTAADGRQPAGDTNTDDGGEKPQKRRRPPWP